MSMLILLLLFWRLFEGTQKKIKKRVTSLQIFALRKRVTFLSRRWRWRAAFILPIYRIPNECVGCMLKRICITNISSENINRCRILKMSKLYTQVNKMYVIFFCCCIRYCTILYRLIHSSVVGDSYIYAPREAILKVYDSCWIPSVRWAVQKPRKRCSLIPVPIILRSMHQFYSLAFYFSLRFIRYSVAMLLFFHFIPIDSFNKQQRFDREISLFEYYFALKDFIDDVSEIL